MHRAGLEGRCKKRWRKTTVADPAAEAARDLIQRHFGPCAQIDRRYVGDITYIATWRVDRRRGTQLHDSWPELDFTEHPSALDQWRHLHKWNTLSWSRYRR